MSRNKLSHLVHNTEWIVILRYVQLEVSPLLMNICQYPFSCLMPCCLSLLNESYDKDHFRPIHPPKPQHAFLRIPHGITYTEAQPHTRTTAHFISLHSNNTITRKTSRHTNPKVHHGGEEQPGNWAEQSSPTRGREIDLSALSTSRLARCPPPANLKGTRKLFYAHRPRKHV